MNSFSKLKELNKRVLYVSRLTSVSRKKIRILGSIFLANISAGLDILIIVIFSKFLTGEISYQNILINKIVEIFVDNKFLLPLIVVIRFGFLFLERINLEFLSLDVMKNLRNTFMVQIFDKGNMSTSDIYYFINTVTMQVAHFYKSVTYFLNYSLQAIAYTSFLFFTEPNVTIIFLIAGLILLFPTKYFVSKGKMYQHISFNEGKEMNNLIQRIVDNLFLIKILSTIDLEIKAFQSSTRKFADSQKYNNVFGGLNNMLPSFFTIFVLAILFVSFELSNLIGLEFIAILLRLFQSLGLLNSGIGLVLNSSVSVEELYKYDIKSPVQNKNNYIISESLSSAVKFTDLKFKYFNSEELILDELNLEIEKNKHTVITGPNGSGKSTILGLIAGLYIPSSGTSEVFSNNIGYVGVTPLVFEGSIKENLLYGNNKNISDSDLIEMLKEFNFFNNDEIKLNKNVNNKSLSSGQLQKVSFMRSLLNDCDILLLDESTSNIDDQSKELIFNILKNKKITIINATHNHNEFNYDVHLRLSIQDNQRIISKQS